MKKKTKDEVGLELLHSVYKERVKAMIAKFVDDLMECPFVETLDKPKNMHYFISEWVEKKFGKEPKDEWLALSKPENKDEK